MRLKIVILLTALSLIMFISPVSAHISANHAMGMVDSFWHIVTEPTHIALLLPAIIVVFLLLMGQIRTRGHDQ